MRVFVVRSLLQCERLFVFLQSLDGVPNAKVLQHERHIRVLEVFQKLVLGLDVQHNLLQSATKLPPPLQELGRQEIRVDVERSWNIFGMDVDANAATAV